jgi:hypothetical protein
MPSEPVPELDLHEALIAATVPFPVVHRAVREGQSYTMWAYISPVPFWPPTQQPNKVEVVYTAEPTPVNENNRRNDNTGKGFRLSEYFERFSAPTWSCSSPGTLLLPVPGPHRQKGAASPHPDAKVILQHLDRPEHIRRDFVACLVTYGRNGLFEDFIDRAHARQLEIRAVLDTPPVVVHIQKVREILTEVRALANYNDVTLNTTTTEVAHGD